MIYAVGLGVPLPAPKDWPATGYPATTPVGSTGGTVTFTNLVTRNLSSDYITGTTTSTQGTVAAEWVGLVPGYVGLYQINVAVPPMPNANWQCSATFPGQYGNTLIDLQLPQVNTALNPPPTDTPVSICVQP